MSATRRDAWEEQDGAGERAGEAQTAWSRRAVLGAAGGGFALARSGLLLPAWLGAEAEAANDPVRHIQHRKDRRRIKQRHKKHQGRHHRRTHGNHKANRSPGALIDGIRWGYYSEAGVFDVEFWVRTNAGHGWGLKDSQRVPNEHFVELRTTDVIGILWINHRYFLRAENVFGAVHVRLGYGGNFGSTGWVDGTTVVDDYVLPEYQNAPDMVVDGFKFTVGRAADDDDYKKPSLSIRKQ
jgi:hypothetical protein